MKTLTTIANEFLENEFGMTLDIPIEINGRLSRAYGRYIHKYNRITGEISDRKIQLAKRLIEYESMDTILDVLKHELVHYALHRLGKPYRDGQAYFENTLSKLDISSTNEIKTNAPLHHYGCECGKTTTRVRRISNVQYKYYSECGHKLEYKGYY